MQRSTSIDRSFKTLRAICSACGRIAPSRAPSDSRRRTASRPRTTEKSRGSSLKIRVRRKVKKNSSRSSGQKRYRDTRMKGAVRESQAWGRRRNKSFGSTSAKKKMHGVSTSVSTDRTAQVGAWRSCRRSSALHVMSSIIRPFPIRTTMRKARSSLRRRRTSLDEPIPWRASTSIRARETE